MDLTPFVGKLDYDGSWLVTPEQEKVRPNPRYTLQELDRQKMYNLGQKFKLRVGLERLKTLHSSHGSEPLALATRDAFRAARDGLPINVRMAQKTVTRGKSVIQKHIFVDFPSDEIFEVDINVAIKLLNTYPNRIIFEQVLDGDAEEKSQDEKIPRPRMKSKK